MLFLSGVVLVTATGLCFVAAITNSERPQRINNNVTTAPNILARSEEYHDLHRTMVARKQVFPRETPWFLRLSSKSCSTYGETERTVTRMKRTKSTGIQEVMDEKTCFDAGMKRRCALQERLKRCLEPDGCVDKAITDWGESYKPFSDSIQTLEQLIEGSLESIEFVVEDLGIPQTMEFERVSLKAYRTNQDGYKEWNEVIQCFVSVDSDGDGVLIIGGIHFTADYDIAPVEHHKNPSEHLFKLLKSVRKDRPVSNFRHIIHHSVQNWATIDMMRKAREWRKVPTDEWDMQTLQIGNSKVGNEDDQADAAFATTLIGTRNGGPYHRILEDYPNAMGKRTIKAVRNWVSQNEEEEAAWSENRDPDLWGTPFLAFETIPVTDI